MLFNITLEHKNPQESGCSIKILWMASKGALKHAEKWAPDQGSDFDGFPNSVTASLPGRACDPSEVVKEGGNGCEGPRS